AFCHSSTAARAVSSWVWASARATRASSSSRCETPSAAATFWRRPARSCWTLTTFAAPWCLRRASRGFALRGSPPPRPPPRAGRPPGTGAGGLGGGVRPEARGEGGAPPDGRRGVGHRPAVQGRPPVPAGRPGRLVLDAGRLGQARAELAPAVLGPPGHVQPVL